MHLSSPRGALISAELLCLKDGVGDQNLKHFRKSLSCKFESPKLNVKKRNHSKVCFEASLTPSFLCSHPPLQIKCQIKLTPERTHKGLIFKKIGWGTPGRKFKNGCLVLKQMYNYETGVQKLK